MFEANLQNSRTDLAQRTIFFDLEIHEYDFFLIKETFLGIFFYYFSR